MGSDGLDPDSLDASWSALIRTAQAGDKLPTVEAGLMTVSISGNEDNPGREPVVAPI